MKKLMLSIIAVAAMAMAFTQQDNKGLARVNEIDGKEVYVLSEPLRNYSVVDVLTSSFNTVMVGRQPINEQIKEVIRRGTKNKLDFDAVLTEDGKKLVLIKFKD